MYPCLASSRWRKQRRRGPSGGVISYHEAISTMSMLAHAAGQECREIAVDAYNTVLTAE